MKNFEDPKKAKTLDWIVDCLVREDFSHKHLEALAHIVGLFNDCKESETEIFYFAHHIYKKYVG